MRWNRGARIAAAVVAVQIALCCGRSEGETDWEPARDFWAFRAPVKPVPPAVRDEGWIRNEIDRFILWRLEREGLRPEPEASEETLIRRLSFDLTGLPPSQRGLDRFLIDAGRDPYGTLVRGLLNSPRYGERFASMWMNVARYGDDHREGRLKELPGAHLYRQWVIDAFNRDLPYDDFVRKQLAADLYGEGDLVALGFLALGPQPPRSPTIEQEADVWADQIDTVTRGFLGLTVACARCHDHFYDPISAEDYYALAGVFASVELDGVMVEMIEAHTVSESILKELRLFAGGGREESGEVIPRRNLRLFQRSGEADVYTADSGRREFAEAITSPTNPLLARVIVNRIWGELFGDYLVETPSEFGHSGARPTHPELLDYLAVRLVENGWSLKWLIREMATSATYRQQVARADSVGSQLYAGMKRRRLTAEMLRDGMLVVTDELTLRHEPPRELSDSENLRRTIYGRVSRVNLDDFLREFDYPNPDAHAPRRETTITPAQKLFLLNSQFVQARAERLASDLDGRAGGLGLDALYFRLFARPPTQRERELALRFFKGEAHPDRERWAKFTQALFSSNQFLYRE